MIARTGRSSRRETIPLVSQLGLHGPQLKTEYPGSYGGQKGGHYGAYSRNFRPLSDLRGYLIFALLFGGAVVCGVSAYYIDDKWPHAGWVRLEIFGLIAAICFVQLYILSSEFLTPFYGRSEYIGVEPLHERLELGVGDRHEMLVLREGALLDVGPELLERGDALALQTVIFGAKVAVDFGVTRLMAARIAQARPRRTDIARRSLSPRPST